MAIRIITNVAADDVPFVEQLMKDSGAIAVTHKQEGDGEFTVTGIFPDIERHAELTMRLSDPGGGVA